MTLYIPIIDLDLIDYSKISIKQHKNETVVLYKYNEGLAPLSINIYSSKITKIANSEKIYIFSNLLYSLRNYIDELYKVFYTMNHIDYEKLKQKIPVHLPELKYRIPLNFITKISRSTLTPSNNSTNASIKITTKEDFDKTLCLYYPYINSTKINVVGKFILQIFIAKNNSFSSFMIFDSDISYEYNKKSNRLYKNTSVVKNNINFIEI